MHVHTAIKWWLAWCLKVQDVLLVLYMSSNVNSFIPPGCSYMQPGFFGQTSFRWLTHTDAQSCDIATINVGTSCGSMFIGAHTEPVSLAKLLWI